MAGAALAATPQIRTESSVYVEQTLPGNRRNLAPADRLSRGDRVVTVVSWARDGGDGAFTIVNALPRTIAYETSARDDDEVSVDGGRNWGRLGTLRIGQRLATPEDVTHVRWRIAALRAAEGRGRIAYSGIVR